VRGVIDLAVENARLERLTPEDRLAFASAIYGDDLLFTSSFGAGSGVLLHMWSRIAPKLPVVFVDTGFLFDETIAYRDAIAAKLKLKIEIAKPAISTSDFLWEHGADIYMKNPDFCCATNRVAPLKPYVARAKGWVSGLRRDQSDTRADVPILLATEDGPVKVHPLATMTSAEADAYMKRYDIPEHPLRARRYLSIGCAPCTRAVREGESERAGRWAGTNKTECGIHAMLRPAR
jgi:phosphoadenosine phosphosulfate reductase